MDPVPVSLARDCPRSFRSVRLRRTPVRMTQGLDEIEGGLMTPRASLCVILSEEQRDEVKDLGQVRSLASGPGTDSRRAQRLQISGYLKR